MPQTPHIERHFTSSEVVRDIVIGMADGLTVPFALAAGLTGAIAQRFVAPTIEAETEEVEEEVADVSTAVLRELRSLRSQLADLEAKVAARSET